MKFNDGTEDTAHQIEIDRLLAEIPILQEENKRMKKGIKLLNKEGLLCTGKEKCDVCKKFYKLIRGNCIRNKRRHNTGCKVCN